MKNILLKIQKYAYYFVGEEYSAQNTEIFLLYLNLLGAFYVTNPRTSKALAEASESTPFVWIDDAWVISYNNNDIAFL